MGQDVMNIKEVASYIGFSAKTVYGMVQGNEMPGFKIRGEWKFPKAEIDRWLNNGARENVKRRQAGKTER